MKVDLRYAGRSEVRELGSAQALAFEPNLARPKVFFDGELLHPVRFREAISCLHEVVVGDLKPPKKDRSRHRAYLEQRNEEEAAVREVIADRAKKEELARIAKEPVPPNLEADFQRLHRVYWSARVRWANELALNDPELFRHLVPCDPVVTVAPDVVFFECFAKDESAYGCLSVERDAFRPAGDVGLGTTNVDYSLALYEHFQTLRTYRPTPWWIHGFESRLRARAGTVREDRSSPSWLRGFGRLQAAITLPARRSTSRWTSSTPSSRSCGGTGKNRGRVRSVSGSSPASPRWCSSSPGGSPSSRAASPTRAIAPRRSRSGARRGCSPWRARCR